MRNIILAATGLMAVAASEARAAPILSAMVFDNGVQVGSTVASATGFLSFAGADASFSAVSLLVYGAPLIPAPDLASQTTRVSTATGFTGTHTLAIAITQVGLTTPLGLIDFASTFTSNFLISGSGVASDWIANYIDTANRGFASTTLLAQVNCNVAVSGTCSTPVMDTLENLTGPYSETEIFSATFTNGGSVVQASSQIIGTNVPEPASVAMLGMGLLGLGVLKRRLHG